jgi:hypothetical protein
VGPTGEIIPAGISVLKAGEFTFNPLIFNGFAFVIEFKTRKYYEAHVSTKKYL